MLNVPVAVGVYVAEQTPFVQVNDPIVPLVAVADTLAAVTFFTRLPKMSRTVMETVAVVVIVIVAGLTAIDDCEASGSAAMTTTLRRMTMRPAESASVANPVVVARVPVSV